MSTDTLVYRINDLEKLLEANAPETTPTPRDPDSSTLSRLLRHVGAAGHMIDTALRAREATRMSPSEVVSELRAANSDTLKQLDAWRRRTAFDMKHGNPWRRTEAEGAVGSSMRAWTECMMRFLQNKDVRPWADENGLTATIVRTLTSTREWADAVDVASNTRPIEPPPSARRA